MYRFDGFTLRPAATADRPLAREWNEADPDHAWEASQENYWTEQKPGMECWLLEDAAGPVFFLKLITVHGSCVENFEIEISIQFAPGDRGLKLRTMQGLSRGMAWLENSLREVGVNAVYYNTKNPHLVRFSVERLGFAEVENDYEPSKALGFKRFKKEL
jgi:hypothetical protein